MATNYEGMTPRIIGEREERIVAEDIHMFTEMHTWRNTFAMQWEESAELIAPNFRNTFYYGTFNWPGQKKTERQIDASGMLANSRFGAICDSLLTPRNMLWHGLEADNPYVMKDRATRLWFDEIARLLFKYRYAPEANFASQNQMVFQSLGAFGNGNIFVDAYDDPHKIRKGFRYRAISLGQTFYRENHQGLVDTCVRWWRMTARQAEQRFPGDLPANLQTAYRQNSEMVYSFLHIVKPNPDFEPGRIGPEGKPFVSHYVSMDGKCLMLPKGAAEREEGYYSFPYAITRYEQFPDEVYGRGPAQMVLPALKTLNAQKRTFLRQGHRASDPVLLTGDDGLTDFVNRPGALNKGGVNSQGKELIKVLPTGNIQINEKMMDMEKALINDAFLVTLFQILVETPQMTATEVIERTNEKGILLAPTIGRQQSEYVGPLIHREIDLGMQQFLFPPMPPRLREARGEYNIVYKNPLARAQRAGEAAGFIRVVETSKEVVNITGDPSYLDWADFDAALPEIATDIQNVPTRWTASDEQVAAKRKARAKAQQTQEQIQAMPAQAAMMKAQAVVNKNQPGLGTAGLGGPERQARSALPL